MKIKRDAFLYLDGDNDRFAQCGTCVLGYDHCRIMGMRKVSAQYGSCGYYIKGRSVLHLAIANLTSKQVGYVERRVRCENCKFYGRQDSTCHLFTSLNRISPHIFDLDDNVHKHGCCNAQTID